MLKYREEGETRRDHLKRLGRVSLAGLATFALVGTNREKIIKEFSQKDPYAFVSGLDFTAYDMKSGFGYEDKTVNIENWRLIQTQRGIFVYNQARDTVWPSAVSTWVEELFPNMLSVIPFYGGVSYALTDVVFGENDDVSEKISFFEKDVLRSMKSLGEITTNNRKLLLRILDDPSVYSYYQYDKTCVKCSRSVTDHIMEKIGDLVAETDNETKTGNFIIEIEGNDNIKRSSDYLAKINRESYSVPFEIAAEIKQDKWFDTSKRKVYDEYINKCLETGNISSIILEDKGLSVEELKRNVDIIKKSVGNKIRLLFRLVFGIERPEAKELEDRMSIVRSSDANGYLLNDKNGLWLFSGSSNPFINLKMERMVKNVNKEIFGIK